MDAGVKTRRKKPTRGLQLRHLEGKPDRQEGMWGISTLVTESIGCVRDLARLLTAVGTLDVEKALAQIAAWKRLEAVYVEGVERPY